ncbi:MAG: HEAT repeat domain-containing protein, partial [Planctomycetota bacterium]
AAEEENSEGPDGLTEAVQAMSSFEIPEGYRVALFAAEPLLANPVAFTFDVFGRAYVAETFRHSKGVTDIRSHMDWLEDDLAIKTVADRVAMFRKHEGDDGLDAGYAVETDRVKRIVDRDGDGVADGASVFAEGFTDPAVGIGAGVLARPLDGSGATEVWFTCIPDTWRLFDRDDDGVAEERESQSEGYGLRVALLGHDLHGLTIGPDGRMYFSIGDRGFNVRTQEGKELVRYGTGAVFRCELDGTDLELFCDGLRNPQELVFDEVGNLFTLDNNSDGGDKARWTMLLQGSDTGWRQAYQWVREPVSRGPWNEEKMWHPYHVEQPAFLLPPIENFTSGPSGLTIYPGTGLGEAWRGKFFVCDFRGAPGYSGIYAFDHTAKGAGFAFGESEKFVWNALPTDVEFGLDGNLYWSDWTNGWNQTGKGRLYRVEPAERSDAEVAAVAETRDVLQQLAAEGAAGSGSEAGREAALSAASGLTDEELVELFHHRDRRVRQEAQLTLAHRALAEADQVEGHRHMVPALKRLREPAEDARAGTARLHCLWTIWHVARRSSALGQSLPKHLTAMLFDQDHEMAAQACRVMGDLGWTPAGRRIPQLLIHESPRVQLYAAQALGGIGMRDTSTAPLVELLENHAATDPWLRHAAIFSLERLGNPGDVHALFEHPNEHVRRAAAVVCRRWGDGAVAALLSDESQLVREEAIRAIHDANIEEAMPALANWLQNLPADGTSHLAYRRCVHACRQVGDAWAVLSLANFAASTNGPLSVRAEALDVLAKWTEPKTRDGILLDHRPLAGASASALSALHDPSAALSDETLSHPTAATDPAPHRILTADFAEELVQRMQIADSSDHGIVAEALVRFLASFPGNGGLARSLATIAEADAFLDRPRRAAFRALLAEAPDDEQAVALVEEALRSPGSPLRAIAFGTLSEEDASTK